MKAKKNGADKILLINQSWCKGCGICVELCPQGALDMDSGGCAVWARPQDCVACGFCELHCPDLAIEVAENT